MGRRMNLISDETITPAVNLSDVMGVILTHIDKARCGIFFCPNICGDPMHNIYNKDGIEIDICEKYEYFEVFGLTEDEERDLEKFYCSLVNSWKNFRQYA